ncbi:MAG: UDP-4-amino-4,6-dideoxy-N-acetyl-beta-L-altrosamine transaminase [Desulfuromonadaceae bacterium]|nr:UDP-4-amino-4,6-dideoxy-N-acetyl-beta-L-altrosamine transaminase [Desulfuromonadaceae bacterium]
MAPEVTLPYGRHQVDDEDVAAVVEVLRSDWLTTGPTVEAFETAVSAYVESEHAVAVSSGTAGLHAALYAIGIGPGDEVLVSPMTFVATVNAVLYQGALPVFVDVEADTLLIDPTLIEPKITPRTKALIAVDYAGQPCDYDALRGIADRHGLYLIADACHSLGASYRGRPVGTLADLTVFSFHPVKPITCGEGGMVVTRDPQLAHRMRCFRNHGIDLDPHQRLVAGTWRYQMQDLGFNYRLSDLHCALGLSQLKKLDLRIAQRQAIADTYDQLFSSQQQLVSLRRKADISHGFHLYVIRLAPQKRDQVFTRLRTQGIGVNVHYMPVHLHAFYRHSFGDQSGCCPVAERAFETILSLPIFPAMQETEVKRVVEALCVAMSEARPS